MDLVVRCFGSFDAAEDAEAGFYAGLSPNERVDLLLEIIASYREALGEAAEGFESVHRIVELARG